MRAEHKKKKSLEYKKKHIYLEKGEKHDKNYSSTQNTSEEKYLPSDESNSLLSRTDVRRLVSYDIQIKFNVI